MLLVFLLDMSGDFVFDSDSDSDVDRVRLKCLVLCPLTLDSDVNESG